MIRTLTHDKHIKHNKAKILWYTGPLWNEKAKYGELINYYQFIHRYSFYIYFFFTDLTNVSAILSKNMLFKSRGLLPDGYDLTLR